MKVSAKRFLIGAGLVLLLVALYAKSNHIVFPEHQRFDDGLDRLNELNSSINRDVLKARSDLLDDYDEFPKQLDEMRDIAGNTAAIPSFVAPIGKQAIRAKMDRLADSLRQKEELLEQFKSQNSLLKNSLRYLPLAGTELVNRLAADGNARDLEILLNGLMRQVLVYSLYPSETEEADVERSLKELNAWRTLHKESPDYAALGSLAAHAQSIVNRKPKVDALTQQLVSLPTGDRIAEILDLYDGQFSDVLRTAESYRVALYILCALLMLGIVHTFYALDKANTHLERHVADRTKDLSNKNQELHSQIAERIRVEAEMERVNKRLVDVSRRAGMAEVATSVLHNVGNVLNSVNISCDVVSEKVRKSKIGNVGKLAGLLREHASDLPGFFAHNPTGKKMPDFVERLSQRLSEEQGFVVDELQLLASNIEHIRSIVAMQQNYATLGGVEENLPVQDLVEDALQMNGPGLDQHGVKVVREYETTPPVLVDKHKVLQILVNLVRNAKHALTDGGCEDKRLTVRIASEGSQVKVTVRDNGIGIPQENLTRIFAHGFTTKANGHGFGLHSGVLAAQQMGGRLSVQSAGLGTGATFILELPLEANRNNAGK